MKRPGDAVREVHQISKGASIIGKATGSSQSVRIGAKNWVIVMPPMPQTLIQRAAAQLSAKLNPPSPRLLGGQPPSRPSNT